MDGDKDIIRIKELFDGEEIEVIYRKGKPGLSKAEAAALIGQEGPPPKFTLPPEPGLYEMTPEIICQRDVSVTLRDGVKIYADIYMPKHRLEKLPLIISWSFFDKTYNYDQADSNSPGAPPGALSGMVGFESGDPAYWCRYGYAVANVSPRGVGNSEGNVSNFGVQDGRDGYDFVEWAARQEWCNGRIGMFGNSAVAMTQLRIAAEQPPHLACIAPWEGTGDLYRESIAFGGVDASGYNRGVLSMIASNQHVESCADMYAEYPLINKYWESKIPRWEDINVPVYICGGWCHFHLRGAAECFRRINSKRKWLRIHRDMEWPDFYKPENTADLHRFFDRYLKNIRNSWEMTPVVRLEVMDAYDYDYDNCHTEETFPIERTEYKKLYLDAASGKVADSQFADTSEVTYDPDTETIAFDYEFTEDTEIIGYSKLKLFIECRGHDNMDLFVWYKKFKADGEYVPLRAMGSNFRGAWGYLRASHRELDSKYSSDFQPVQAHRREEKLAAGEIVPVEIEIWPHARIWHKGEHLRLEISGRFIKSDWFEDRAMQFATDNGEGHHVIHTGGEYASFLQIPVIPPKYRSGDFIVR